MDNKYIPKRTFKNLTIRDLYFRNFKGVDRFNPKNDQPTFAIFLDDDLAETMRQEGWYIRTTKVKPDAPDGVVPRPYLKVTVKFDTVRPPMVKMIDGGVETVMDKTTIKVLDSVNIAAMSVRVRAYVWDDSGKYGASAILDRLQVLVKPDEMDSELSDWLAEAEEPPFDID